MDIFRASNVPTRLLRAGGSMFLENEDPSEVMGG